MNPAIQRQLPPIVRACLSILIGITVALLGQAMIKRWTEIDPSFFWAFIAGGIFAALIGQMMRLPIWWAPLNLVVPVAAYLSLSAPIPAWVYLLCFISLALIYWNSADERVPLYLSNPTTWRAVESLTAGQAGHFIDLGCGLGGTLFYLARNHPDKHYVGIESAPIPYLIAKLRQWLSGLPNIDIRYGDFWNEDFAAYEVIYAFLSPAPMARLYKKISEEMPSGGLFISNSFSVPEIKADDTQSLDDRRQTELFIWRVHAKPDGN